MSLTITLVRHGQTTKNLEKKIQTRTDALLSELGVMQAEALGKKLAEETFTHSFTSDKKRTIDTANLILKHNKNPIPEIVIDERLRERDFGDWEDTCVVELHEKATTMGVRMFKMSPPNGEDYDEFAAKGLAFFHDIGKLQENLNGETHILIVTHGGFILSLFDTFITNPKLFDLQNFVVDETIRTPPNTSATKFILEKENEQYKIKFLSIFDAGHFESLNGLAK